MTAIIPIRKTEGASADRRGAAIVALSSLENISFSIGSLITPSPAAQGRAIRAESLRLFSTKRLTFPVFPLAFAAETEGIRVLTMG